MRFVVVGAGAIGAYVGAALARGGADVTLVARGEHLRAMQDRGVRVRSPRGDFEAHPAATDDLDVVADADVVYLGVKAYSLPEIAPRLGKLLPSGAAIIAGQNGLPFWYFQSHGGSLDGLVLDSVDPGGIVAASIAPESVIGCVLYSSTEIVEPGVIRHIEGTRFAIGEPSGVISERCKAIADAFVAGGLKCPVEERLRDHIWLKLIGNAAFNPVTALTGSTLGELGIRPEMVKLLRALLEEGAEIGTALGIELPVSIERRLEAAIAVGDHKTSMLHDLEAGKPLELDCMTGALIELAARLGIDVPRTEAIHACVTLVESLTRERVAVGDAA
jgi:2-dehydropantoate 2-reductase